MKIRNVHERRIPSALPPAQALLDSLAGSKDGLWPHDRWPAMQFDRPLGVGATGGHGPVRYQVTEYVPGQRVVFRFDSAQGLMRGFTGSHRFELSENGREVVFRHVIEADGGLGPLLRWLLLVRPLHDALLEDAFDRTELALTGQVRSPAAWSRYVRLLRWLVHRRNNRATK